MTVGAPAMEVSEVQGPPARTSGLAAASAPPERACAARTVRCATINTHRGSGPKIDYLLKGAPAAEAERIELLHDTRAYAYHIAEWLGRRRGEFDVVALQEVFNGILGFGERILGKFRQRDYYRVLSGFGDWTAHGVGFAGFRYENLLLSSLPPAEVRGIQRVLPGRVLLLAACGFTLAPYLLDGRTVWIGNTHLHAYSPRARMRQAECIARVLPELGDAPVLFLGDFNTVPPGCKDGDFPAGDRDVNAYRGDGTLRILERAGLRAVSHRDTADFHTYPTGAPNRTLDYILFTRHWEVEGYRVLLDFRFSDHYPVAGEFRLK